MNIEWSSSALKDLKDIILYTSKDNLQAAKKLNTLIRNSIEKIVIYPKIGRIGRSKATREHIIIGTPYIVIYSIESDFIGIVRVIHHAQSWPSRKKE